MNNSGLRSRILVGFAVFIAVQCVLMIVLAIYSYHRGEDQALRNIVQSEITFFDFSSEDPVPKSLPTRLMTIPPGVHELSGQDDDELSGFELHAFVYKENDQTRFRVLKVEERNNWWSLAKVYGLFSALTILIIGGFGGWAGKTIAQRISEPMERLSRKLADSNMLDNSVAFVEPNQSRELAEVANALEHSFSRIRQTRERERMLSRNISHELRTPLTVIRTALDTGNDEKTPPSTNALGSARRACDDMELLTGACIELAREPDSQRTLANTNLSGTTKQIVRESLHLLEGKDVHLDVHIQKHELLFAVDESLARLVIGNMIRNGFIHCTQGTLEIELTEHRLTMKNPAKRTDASHQHTYGRGFGIGLSILGQTCERLGWQFDMSERENQDSDIKTVISSVRFTNS